MRDGAILSEMKRIAGITPLWDERRLVEKHSDLPQAYGTATKTVAMELLAKANKIPIPLGFGSFGATCWERMRQVQLLFDVPPEVLNPKSYPPEAREGRRLEHWTEFLKEIDHLLVVFRRKYPDIAIQKRRQPDDAESEILARAKASKLR